MVGQLTLCNAIGFSGKIPGSLVLHTTDQYIFYTIGSTIVIKNVENHADQTFLQGHDDRVMCMALSNCGNYLASGQISHLGSKAIIILWDVSCLHGGSGAPIQMYRLKLHTAQVQALSFSATGKYLASIGGADDNNLVIWNVDTGMAICGSPASHDECKTVKWMNQDEEMLVTGSINNCRVWTLDVAQRKIKPNNLSTAKEVRNVTCVAIEDNDKTAYIGTSTGDVLVVDVASKKMFGQGPSTKDCPQCGVTSIALVGDELLIGSGAGQLLTLDKKSLVVKTSQVVSGGVTSIAMDSAKEFFFAGTTLSNMYLVQYDGLVCELKTTAHSDEVNDVVFPTAYAELFATCAGSDIRIWHSNTLAELLRVQVPNQTCNCLQFTKDGTSIVSGWNDGKIRAFLPQSGGLHYVIHEAHRLTGVGNSSGGVVPSNGVTAVAPSNNGERLLSGGADGQVRVWAIAKGTQVMIASMKEHKGPVYSIAVKADDSECVSASADGSCITWSLTDAQPFVRVNALFAANFFTSVKYHPDESQLITCGTDRKITYWDCLNMSPIRVIDASESAALNALAITDDGAAFVSGSSDKKIKLWNYDEGSCYYEGIGHSGAVRAIKISPDESKIISVGSEGGIYVWEFAADCK